MDSEKALWHDGYSEDGSLRCADLIEEEGVLRLEVSEPYENNHHRLSPDAARGLRDALTAWLGEGQGTDGEATQAEGELVRSPGKVVDYTDISTLAEAQQVRAKTSGTPDERRMTPGSQAVW